ncbi:MAG: phosphatase PAP2 family protein [Desulfobacterales bacterium]|jgi:membrane-associated phospholipid phosphatase
MLKPEDILDWGIEVVLWFQQFSPALDLPFQSVTFLGNLEFFLLFMPLIYWCIDRRMGARLLVLFLISAYINAIAKAVVGQPRPFQYDPRVQPLVHATGGGLPSGHTQGTVVLWGYLVSQHRSRKLWIIAGFLMIAVPISRLYLGVHFPTDLLGGYLLGAILLVLYLRFVLKVEAWLVAKGVIWQTAAAVILPIILFWASPQGSRYALSACGALLGFLPGIALERRWVRFRSDGSLLKRSVRFILGLVVLFGIWLGLRFAFSELEPMSLLQAVRYACVGLWGALGAPWLFVQLRLSETEEQRI